MAASSPDQARAQQAAKDKANANKANAARDHKNSLYERFGGDNPKYFLDFDPSGRVRILQTIVDGKTEKQQKFLIVNPDGISYSFANNTQIINAVRKMYSKQKEALRKQLFDLDYITEREYNTRSEAALNSGILSAANEFTVEVVDSYTVDGVTKFPTFTNWLSGKPATGDDGGKKDLPVRDIELIDRGVVEAMVKDFYMEELQKEVDPEIIKAKTDRAMKRIKEGSLTTIKEGGKEVTRTTTPRFSQSELEADLGKEIPVENKLDYNQKQSIDFISFLAGLEG